MFFRFSYIICLHSKEYRFMLSSSASASDVARDIRLRLGLKDDKTFNVKWLDIEGESVIHTHVHICVTIHPPPTSCNVWAWAAVCLSLSLCGNTNLAVNRCNYKFFFFSVLNRVVISINIVSLCSALVYECVIFPALRWCSQYGFGSAERMGWSC